MRTPERMQPLFVDAPPPPSVAVPFPHPEKPPWGLIGLAAIALAASLIILALACLRGLLSAPYGDDHDWIAQVFATQRTGDWLAYLWRPHTAQRIPFVRLLQMIDVQLWRRQGPAFLICVGSAYLFSLAALAVFVLRQKAVPATIVATTLVVGLILTNVALAEPLAWPVFSVYALVLSFALLAMVVFETAADGPRGLAVFCTSLVLAVLACCGNAAGLAIWPTLIICALRRGIEARRLRLLIGSAVLCLVLFQSGLGTPSQTFGTAPMLAPAHLLKMADYLTVFAVLPWGGGGFGGVALRLVGLAVEAAALAAVVRYGARRGAHAGFARLGTAMIVFGLITAVLATVGRVDELPSPIVPTRYFPFAAMIQAGLVLACIEPLEKFLHTRPRLAHGVLCGLAALFLTSDAVLALRFGRAAAQVRAASSAFDQGDRSPRVVLLVHPKPAFAARIRAELKVRGLR